MVVCAGPTGGERELKGAQGASSNNGRGGRAPAALGWMLSFHQGSSERPRTAAAAGSGRLSGGPSWLPLLPGPAGGWEACLALLLSDGQNDPRRRRPAGVTQPAGKLARVLFSHAARCPAAQLPAATASRRCAGLRTRQALLHAAQSCATPAARLPHLVPAHLDCAINQAHAHCREPQHLRSQAVRCRGCSGMRPESRAGVALVAPAAAAAAGGGRQAAAQARGRAPWLARRCRCKGSCCCLQQGGRVERCEVGQQASAARRGRAGGGGRRSCSARRAARVQPVPVRPVHISWPVEGRAAPAAPPAGGSEANMRLRCSLPALLLPNSPDELAAPQPAMWEAPLRRVGGTGLTLAGQARRASMRPSRL